LSFFTEHRLHVDRDRDVAGLAIGEGGAAGDLDDILDVRGAHHAGVVGAGIGEDFVELDILLGAGGDQIVMLEAGDRQHRHMVHLRVVNAVQEVDSAGSRRREADAEPSGELRIAHRRQRRRLLVPHLHEADLVLPGAQRLHDAVDAVARQAEDGVDAPGDEGVDEQVCGGLGHDALPVMEREGQSPALAAVPAKVPAGG
jgi:hypothetical protein